MLLPNIQESDTYRSFKLSLRSHTEFEVLYYYGDRWPAVHHARMRTGCSKLKYDLFHNLHVVDSPACQCGYHHETAEHFLLYCPQWHEYRLPLFAVVQNIFPITTVNLLFGSREVNIEENKVVFSAVHRFIKNTERFA